jgi:hypothetical protein
VRPKNTVFCQILRSHRCGLRTEEPEVARNFNFALQSFEISVIMAHVEGDILYKLLVGPGDCERS